MDAQKLRKRAQRRYDIHKAWSWDKVFEDDRFPIHFPQRTHMLTFKHDMAHVFAAHHLGYDVTYLAASSGTGVVRICEKGYPERGEPAARAETAAINLSPAWINAPVRRIPPSFDGWSGITDDKQAAEGKALLASFGVQLSGAINEVTAQLPSETWAWKKTAPNHWSGSTLELDDPWNDPDFPCEEIYQKHFGKGARNDTKENSYTGSAARSGNRRQCARPSAQVAKRPELAGAGRRNGRDNAAHLSDWAREVSDLGE